LRASFITNRAVLNSHPLKRVCGATREDDEDRLRRILGHVPVPQPFMARRVNPRQVPRYQLVKGVFGAQVNITAQQRHVVRAAMTIAIAASGEDRLLVLLACVSRHPELLDAKRPCSVLTTPTPRGAFRCRNDMAAGPAAMDKCDKISREEQGEREEGEG
jgi:hypothetical protein